jgi:uncharacterized protein
VTWLLTHFGPPAAHVGVTYYLWRRLIHDPGVRGRARTIATAALIVLMTLTPLTIMAMRLHAGWLSNRLAWVAFPWMGLAGLAFVLFGARDAVRGALWLARRAARRPAAVADPDRRQFLARVTGGAIATAAVGTAAVGARVALGEHRVETVEVTLARLPAALDGFTLAQVSDLHIGMTITRGFVEDVVAATNRLGADLIALTGDIVDGGVRYVAPRTEPLADLRAPHGVFAITGNHEFYSGVHDWLPVLERLGLRFLHNERVAIGRGGATFDLVGIEDPSGAHHGWPPDLGRALLGRDPTRATVLLAHQPRQVRDAAAHGVDLQLSGHTHGGQVWPWHYVVRLQQGGFLSGRDRVGDTQLFTSRGVGYWGPPIRVGAPPEIVRVVLRAPAAVRAG